MASITKTKRVENYLRSQIARGVWVAGDRLPPNDQIGAHMGVSDVTVKNAMVRLAEDGLLERKQRSGTCVASVIKTSNIGILCPAEALSSKVGFYYQQLLAAAKSAIIGAGYRPVLAVGQGKGDEFLETISLFDSSVARNTIGALAIACPQIIHETLQDKGIHVISIGMDGTAPAVITDYAEALDMAAAQLYDYGYEDYVLMTMDPHPSDRGNYCYTERERMIRACAGFGAERWVSVPWSGPDYGSVYDEFKRFWAGGRRPQAIYFPDDGVCDAAMRAMLELGIRVPGELGIITESCAGRDFHFPVPVTRIEFNPTELIAVAYDLLSKMIAGGEADGRIVNVKPRLRPGRSL